jgi:outer membrane lipoprotein LolB
MKTLPAWPLGPLLMLLLLQGCSTSRVKESLAVSPELAYQQRSSKLRALEAWDLFGRLSMDDGEDGGSGRLHWSTREETRQLDFRGALGRGAWRLNVGPGVAKLEKGDGTSTAAPTVDQLIQQEIGWRIPVNSLQWWVLGVAAPGEFQGMDLDEAGLVRRLRQDGWIIEFERYQRVEGFELPRKMEAVSGRYRVKLAVSRWSLKTGDFPGG